MNKILISLLIILSSSIHAAPLNPKTPAEKAPLRIVVSSFNAPFVMQGNHKQFYGYDIALMQYICRDINRTCVYVPGLLSDIFKSISTEQADLGISSIVLTPHRAKIFSLSIPYMASEGQFIGPMNLNDESFNIDQLNRKKIGVIQGSSYSEFIKKLNLVGSTIVSFPSSDQLVEALQKKLIDFGALDSHTVKYWENNSNETLHSLGKPFPIGYGLTIIGNINDNDLMQQINTAIFHYTDSPDFKINYQQYLDYF